MQEKYYWIGGSTGSTLADRFDWNVAANWRVVKQYSPWAEDIEVEVATDVPGYLDYVNIGGLIVTSGGQKTAIKATSPLLFGGFSGDVSNGGWSAGSYGATGTTWTSSLIHFEIRGDKLKQDFASGTTFTYQFPVIGNGFTAANIIKLKKCIVEGMTYSNWDYLQNIATTRQNSGIRVKATNNVIDFDAMSNRIAWNPISGITSTTREIYLDIVDNYGFDGSSDNDNSLTFGCLDTRLTLNNSFLAKFISVSAFLKGPSESEIDAHRNRRNQDLNYLNIKNSTIQTIFMDSYINTTIERSCLVGSFILDFTNSPKKYINPGYDGQFGQKARLYLGGTYDAWAAARRLRSSPIGLTGVDSILINAESTIGLIPDTGIKTPGLEVNLGNYFENPVVGFNLEAGITFNARQVKILGPSQSTRGVTLPVNLWNSWDERIHATILGPCIITDLEIGKCIFYGNFTPYSVNFKGKEARIRTFFLRNESTLSITEGTNTPIWKFGEINTTNYYGGLIFENPTVFDADGYPVNGADVRASSNNWLLNYGVIADRNIRSGVAYTGYEEISTIDIGRPRK